MDFKTDKPIYRQIIDYCFGRIMAGSWQPGAKVPSVRELAVQMAVNTHTVLKAFDQMQQSGIIVSRRGMGFFLADDARDRVDEQRRQEFFDTHLEELFREMDMLGIGIDDIAEKWRQRGS